MVLHGAGEGAAPEAAAAAVGRRRRRRNCCLNNKFEKSLLAYALGLCLVGMACNVLQVEHYVNGSVLSHAQFGLWAGFLFAITGALSMGHLTSTPPSLLVSLSCCLLCVFVALALASLSWFGLEASNYCQYRDAQCANNATDAPPQSNETLSVLVARVLHSVVIRDQQQDDIPCDQITQYCGVSVRTSKVLHAALLTLATVGATLSFGLANAITANPHQWLTNSQARPSIFTTTHTDTAPGGGGGPVSPWQFPEPDKRPQEEEPPPPYQQLAPAVDSAADSNNLSIEIHSKL